MRNLLLISSSRLHGYTGYLEAFENDVQQFLNTFKVSKVLFIPYALKHHDKYLEKVLPVFKKLGFEIEGIHQHENPTDAINAAQAVFVGGGNTFLLLKTLYDHSLIEPLRARVLKSGMPYMGVSAGTNVATRSINTSNDMPIVHPPSFEALQLVPFNINPHYVETEKNTKHMGETRDERIGEFLDNTPEINCVLGLREGGLLHVVDDKILLKGVKGAKLFKRDAEPQEFDLNADLSFLMMSF